MEDFEYSVDICDRDWECFFAQCEECNVLPPSLAGLEDSGMSDMEDLGAVLAKRVQKADPKAGFLEEDLPVDGPPVCEGSPEELYLSKHVLGGMESVLSGSEEDIHLQSVNIFFERMKSLTDPQKTTEQSQVGAIKNRAVQGELCSDWKPASCTGSTLPRNIPKLNSGSARGEAATGTDTTQPVSAIRYTNTMKTDECGSESSASNSVKQTTELLIGEETCIKPGVNKILQPHDSLDRAVCSEVTRHANKTINLEKETVTMCDVRKEELMRTHSARCKTQSTDSLSNPDITINGKWKEDKSTPVSQSDTERINKPTSKESSPCASFKRKRRKKRRLCVEPAESGFGCERLYDSEDERFTWRGAIEPCLSKDLNWSRFKEPQINCGFMPPLSTYTLSSSLPVSLAAKEITIKHPFQPNPCLNVQESIFIQASSAEKKRQIEVKELNKYYGVPVIDIKIDKEQLQDKVIKEIDPESVAISNSNPVKSITLTHLPSVESNDSPVDVGQSERVSTAKSVMREEAGIEKLYLCQREIEVQQLETACRCSYQSSPTAENMTPLSETALSTSNVSEPLDHKTRRQCTSVVSDLTGLLLDEHSQILSNLIMKSTKQETEYNAEVEDLSQNDLSPNHEELSGAAAPQDRSEGNLVSSNTTLSPSHSPVTEPDVPLLNKNIPQTLESSRSSVVHSDLKRQEELEPTTQTKSLVVSHDSKEPCCEVSDGVEVATETSQPEQSTAIALNSDHTVFAMSSFWKEMEKLTINDILGLRKEGKAQPSFLPPLQETDDTDYFTLSDSSCCTQTEDRTLEQTSKEASAIPDPVDTISTIAITSDSSSSRSVRWESEPLSVSLSNNIYPDSRTLTTVSDSSEPIISPALRRISKNISVQNLRALESQPFTYKLKSQTTLSSLDEDKCNDIGYIPEHTSSLTESFKVSVMDIFQYFFGEKQSDTGQSPTDNTVNSTDGDTVPETYDQFFSEFDTDSFFYPLAQTTDVAKNELVPIFSCSRSSKRKLEFPEAYDYFFASSSDNSSSDNSSSDEEDKQERAPIRVVTRFTRKASSKEIFTDAYEHFYTDRDLQQDFFKTTFSFRNALLTGNKTPTNTLSVRPLTHGSRSCRIKAITVLGTRDLVFADPLLYHFDDQISRKLQQPLLYDNLQTAVANPRSDAPLLPLQQSDMCLICIAFASWVLKTANPQVGDTWKAVLLANVSALSAIRYLRKYIKVEAAASEKKPNLKAVSDS